MSEDHLLETEVKLHTPDLSAVKAALDAAGRDASEAACIRAEPAL